MWLYVSGASNAVHYNIVRARAYIHTFVIDVHSPGSGPAEISVETREAMQLKLIIIPYKFTFDGDGGDDNAGNAKIMNRRLVRVEKSQLLLLH